MTTSNSHTKQLSGAEVDGIWISSEPTCRSTQTRYPGFQFVNLMQFLCNDKPRSMEASRLYAVNISLHLIGFKFSYSVHEITLWCVYSLFAKFGLPIG